MRGKFTAIDDIDMAGHRIRDWRWLNDIYTKDAIAGQVLSFDGEDVRWATVSGTGTVIYWDDVNDKPTEFPPEDHAHTPDDIDGLRTSIHVVFGDGLSAIRDTAGSEDQVDFVVPYDMTITEWSLLADQSGDIELDVRSVSSVADFPPDALDTIVGANAPTLSSTSINQTTGLSWDLAEGDFVRVFVDTASVTDITRVTLSMTGERT